MTTDAAQCVVNMLRPSCTGAFTKEAAGAGLSRCKSAGYDRPDPIATSCDGGYSSTFDMSRNGAVPDDMIMSAFNSDCVVRLTKRN